MNIVIIPGFIGHSKEKAFEKLKEVLISKGHNVTIIDWPNFPNNLNKYNFTNTISYTKGVIQKINNENLIIIGHSMGGIIATYLASEFNPKKLILVVSPYQAGTKDDLEGKYRQWKETGFREIPSSRYGILKIPFSFIEDAKKYNALDYIDKVTSPKLFVVAGNDEKVSREASEIFFDKAKESKEWVLIPDAEHKYQYQSEEMLNKVNDIIIKFIES